MIGINNLGFNGRLGNQMFQYSAMVGIAKNLKYDYCIPDNNNDLSKCFKLESCKNRGTISGDEIILHDSHEFCLELFNECPDNVTLTGYFQSEKYFENVKDLIRKDFTFNDEIYSKVLSLFPNIGEYNSIVVRRYEDDFDYVGCSKNHRNIPIEYYEEAVRIIGNNEKYIVCSNNVNWCKSQTLFKKENFIINDIDIDIKAYFDLCLTSLCKNFIISNSSFSWWGAWLGKIPNKVIISPKLWYGENLSHIITKDLIPDNWRLLDL